ncbi:MAG TPA: hypothetical protein PKI93_02700 [Alphaproteobacteria bacterium]|nr:hypothetical protein [Alphaproteobacteria bacterium]HNS44991.1 hypothetical protein [Alphaproteobacteria bacterium]
MSLKSHSIFLILITFLSSLAPMAHAQERLTNDNRETAQEMGAMYGQYLFNSYCLKSYSMYMADDSHVQPSASNPEAAKKLTDGCACMTKVMSENVSSNSMIMYVMTMEGSSPMEAKSPAEVEAYFRRNDLGKIGDMADDEQLRKKCGFLR